MSFSELLEITDEDLKNDLKVTKLGHRKRILASLRNKRERLDTTKRKCITEDQEQPAKRRRVENESEDEETKTHEIKVVSQVVKSVEDLKKLAGEIARRLKQEPKESWPEFLRNILVCSFIGSLMTNQKKCGNYITRHVLSRLSYLDLVELKDKTKGDVISRLISNNVINSAIEWENWYLWKLQQEYEQKATETNKTNSFETKIPPRNLLVDIYDNLSLLTPRYLDEFEEAFPVLAWPAAHEQISIDECMLGFRTRPDLSRLYSTGYGEI